MFPRTLTSLLECFLENTECSQVKRIDNKHIFYIHDEASTVSFQKGLEGRLSFKINIVAYTVSLLFQPLVGLSLCDSCSGLPSTRQT